MVYIICYDPNPDLQTYFLIEGKCIHVYDGDRYVRTEQILTQIGFGTERDEMLCLFKSYCTIFISDITKNRTDNILTVVYIFRFCFAIHSFRRFTRIEGRRRNNTYKESLHLFSTNHFNGNCVTQKDR